MNFYSKICTSLLGIWSKDVVISKVSDIKLSTLVVLENFSPEIMFSSVGRGGVKKRELTLHYLRREGDVGAKKGLHAEHSAHCTLDTAHCTLRTAHCTLDTAHCTLRTAHCTLRTMHTLHTVKYAYSTRMHTENTRL